MNKIKNFLLKIASLLQKFIRDIYRSTIDNLYIILIMILFIGYFIRVAHPPTTHNEVEYEYTIYRSMSELHYSSVKEKTINEIDKYIDSVAPNSCLNGISILEACEEYNIDIIFVLAQAQLESHFGTTGIAMRTNSVWNVLAYDGRSAGDMIKKGHGYDHPDKSIKPYLELLNKKYLSETITEYDLLKKFVNKDGKRYASDKNYEQKLSNLYNRIMDNTDIFENYQEYRKYKIILQAK